MDESVTISNYKVIVIVIKHILNHYETLSTLFLNISAKKVCMMNRINCGSPNCWASLSIINLHESYNHITKYIMRHIIKKHQSLTITKHHYWLLSVSITSIKHHWPSLTTLLSIFWCLFTACRSTSELPPGWGLVARRMIPWRCAGGWEGAIWNYQECCNQMVVALFWLDCW